MFRVMILMFLALFISIPVYGQNGEKNNSDIPSVNRMLPFFRDSTFIPDQNLVKKYNPQKPLWVPFTETLGLNLAIGSFNRYVMDKPYSYINCETIKANFKYGFGWDADGLLVNMWGHPFQGSIYYNTARATGYNYWTSFGVTAFGSLQWEFFMENEHPAINDLIMTSFGGAMYGEMFYRLSNLIIKESVGGANRVIREVGAGIINSGRLLNRLIYGRVGRKTDYQLYQKEPNMGELTIGANHVAEGVDFKNGESNQMLTFEYYYGNLFYKRSYKPMDYFNFYTILNFGNKQPTLGQFRISGVLAAKQKTVGDGNKLLWGFFQSMDYLNNNVYEIAGYSIGAGIGFRTSREKKHVFATVVNASFMPMGAANSDYAPNYVVDGFDTTRTYNMGSGASTKIDAYWLFPGGDLSIRHSFWWVHTMQGAPGNEFIGILQPRLRIRIIGRWYLGAQYLLYHRFGKYEEYADISIQNNEFRAFIGFRF